MMIFQAQMNMQVPCVSLMLSISLVEESFHLQGMMNPSMGW